MTEDKITMIRVRESTRARLEKFGKFKESYDDVITRLLDERSEK